MDLQEQIFKALDGKDYSDFDKIRWIYLYVCKMFSYDARYNNVTQNMKEIIYNKKINLANVEDFEIVCYTMARILLDALALFGFKGEIIKETDKYLTHVYVIVKHEDFILKLDPTKRHDITRVKMNSTTLDFESLSDDESFSDKLLHADKKMASNFNGLYISGESVIKKIEEKIKEIDILSKINNLSDNEIFFKKLEVLFEMINSRTDLKRYDDIDFYYSYLLKNFKINQKKVIENGNITFISCNYVRPTILFNVNDKNMRDIINISYVQYEDLPPIFYLLKKEEESFKMREIFRDEALEILSQYESPQCQYMLEQLAQKLPVDKKNGIIF